MLLILVLIIEKNPVTPESTELIVPTMDLVMDRSVSGMMLIRDTAVSRRDLPTPRNVAFPDSASVFGAGGADMIRSLR